MEYAVSKRDLHIMRERWAWDPMVDMFPEKPEKPTEPKEAPPQAAPVPSALAFTTAGLHAAPGKCAGPIRVETRDASGKTVAAAAPVSVNLTAVPPSAVFFSDAQCATALSSASVGTGTGATEIYFRAMQAGALRIDVSATALTGASQTHTVDPARAVAVAFTTPPQAVASGACSSAVTIQARDALDDPASVTVPAAVQLLATPAGSITFHARPDCAGAAITSTSIPANGNSASFYFKGRRSQKVTIAAALDTGHASQEEIVTSASR